MSEEQEQLFYEMKQYLVQHSQKWNTLCDIEQLIIDKDKEIERLGNELQVQIEDNTRLNEYIEAQDKKLQQKEKIIKEVREYIEKYLIQNDISNQDYQDKYKELLEILDKEL